MCPPVIISFEIVLCLKTAELQSRQLCVRSVIALCMRSNRESDFIFLRSKKLKNSVKILIVKKKNQTQFLIVIDFCGLAGYLFIMNVKFAENSQKKKKIRLYEVECLCLIFKINLRITNQNHIDLENSMTLKHYRQAHSSETETNTEVFLCLFSAQFIILFLRYIKIFYI